MVYDIGIDGLFKSHRGPKAELSNFTTFKRTIIIYDKSMLNIMVKMNNK